MTDTPASTFRAYVRAFESLDPDAAAPFYHLPSLFIAPQGVIVAPDAEALRGLLAGFMAQLHAQAYRRTDVFRLETRALGAELASCSGVFTRFDVSGREIARLGFTYTMRAVDGGWKIVVAAVHEPVAG